MLCIDFALGAPYLQLFPRARVIDEALCFSCVAGIETWDGQIEVDGEGLGELRGGGGFLCVSGMDASESPMVEGGGLDEIGSGGCFLCVSRRDTSDGLLVDGGDLEGLVGCRLLSGPPPSVRILFFRDSTAVGS